MARSADTSPHCRIPPKEYEEHSPQQKEAAGTYEGQLGASPSKERTQPNDDAVTQGSADPTAKCVYETIAGVTS